MSIQDMTGPAAESYLLRLFQKDVKERLVQAGIDAVRPAIERAAAEAVASLQPQVEAHYAHLQQQVVVKLTICGEHGK